VNGARSLHLVIALATLLLLLHAMFFKEEFVYHLQIRIVTDLRPSAKAVSVNTDQEHGIFFSTPSTRVASGLRSVRETKRVPVIVAAYDLSEKLKLLRTFYGRFSIDLLEIAKVYQNSLAVLLRESLPESLFFFHHLSIVIVHRLLGCLDEFIEDRLDVFWIPFPQLGFLDDFIPAIIH
jgi:hypothetical protein